MASNAADDLPVLAIMGPTASGKTEAVLGLAETADIEVVSVDSGQVYRGMDIGTAKPSAAERRRTRHWLVDVCEPDDAYSAAQFRADAIHAVINIRARGRLPVLVGGSMFYFNVLEKGLPDSPPASRVIREAIATEARAVGWPALHARIDAIDPCTAQRIDRNDAQRIQRALEIIEVTGGKVPQRLPDTTGHLQLAKLALVPSDRKVLHQRIAIRAEAMMAQGLVSEVINLLENVGVNSTAPAMRAVGYRQIEQSLAQGVGESVMLERVVAATRQLAKRQLTWLRGMTGLTWCPSDHPRCHHALGDYLERKLPSLIGV